MTASPACPHGIPLDKFCQQLHLTSQPHKASDVQPACPHGIALDTFCRNLHRGEPR
jgi:hypothetical protein